jgi:hypothetical protein
VPATLVLITPEVSAADLPAYAKEYGMDNALWANDPANVMNISLNNILQSAMYAPGGNESNLGFQGVAARVEPVISGPSAGTFHYPVEGLTDPKAKELWWMVERQKPEAVKTLVAVAKQKSPLGVDSAKTLAVVKAALEARQAELVEAPATMATYESLESLLTEGQGIELKKAGDRYKELGKAKELKDELTARTIYRQCQEMLASPRPPTQAAGKENLAALAKKLPGTVYGRLAASSK